MNQVSIKNVSTNVNVTAATVYGRDVIDIPEGFKYERFGIPPEGSHWLTPSGMACWEKQGNPRVILSKLVPAPPPEPLTPNNGTFECTIRPYDIYGDKKIDFTGYDIVGFRPPMKGEQYFTAGNLSGNVVLNTAPFNYLGSNARYIVRQIPPPPPVIKPFEVRKTYTVDDIYNREFVFLLNACPEWEYVAFRLPVEGEYYIPSDFQYRIPIACNIRDFQKPRLIVTRKA